MIKKKIVEFIKKNIFFMNLVDNISEMYLSVKEKILKKYVQFFLKRNVRIYNKNKIERKNIEGVIYTCITGEYDTLKSMKYVNTNWDYICFTDNREIKTDGIWEIRPLQFDKLDDSRNNRWHKINPHLILRDYKRSIYIDGNIRIKSKKFFEMLRTYENELFVAPKHPRRICLYEEANRCKQLKLERKELIDKQINLIKMDGYPKNKGLYEANIIYRQHLNTQVIEMEEMWWNFIKNMAGRDQLSLTYCCWKKNIPFITFSNINFRKLNSYVYITPHLKKRDKK